jgi:hypothetical protein
MRFHYDMARDGLASARSARAFERGDVDSVSLVNDGAQEVMKLLIPNANAAVPLVFQPVQ